MFKHVLVSHFDFHVWNPISMLYNTALWSHTLSWRSINSWWALNYLWYVINAEHPTSDWSLMLKSTATIHSPLLCCQWDNVLSAGCQLEFSCLFVTSRSDGISKYSYDTSSWFVWSNLREYAEKESCSTLALSFSHCLSMVTKYTKETPQ